MSQAATLRLRIFLTVLIPLPMAIIMLGEYCFFLNYFGQSILCCQLWVAATEILWCCRDREIIRLATLYLMPVIQVTPGFLVAIILRDLLTMILIGIRL